MKNYLHATPETGKQFYLDFHKKGEIVMLNLLKFKVTADYSALPALRPAETITGAAAYALYMKHTAPLLEQAGSRILFSGTGKEYLIGPEGEQWDAVLLVAHVSVEVFMKFAQSEDYLQYAGHRTAALEDSRLLPLSPSRI
ncbi:DUF1330 domain-containing protein [Aquimarina hainanensis]|uniref:DUF1330 domain-containing protein n=1 Tax=Aquimarina hainanensis TaxID=1578017 RepID=A0ABW5NGX6_9FLAO|nr:DUF1330 domain-containing protein [Aquimarina sp. TRL1]QKX07324.1 DUF1330 domain-containing protein [Aquimarina sp. TRL1]